MNTNPPAGAGLATTVVRRHVTLQLQHHDRASLLVGKLHALLQREYAKGRDLYDLLWYLSDPAWPAPTTTRRQPRGFTPSPFARSFVKKRKNVLYWQ